MIRAKLLSAQKIFYYLDFLPVYRYHQKAAWPSPAALHQIPLSLPGYLAPLDMSDMGGGPAVGGFALHFYLHKKEAALPLGDYVYLRGAAAVIALDQAVAQTFQMGRRLFFSLCANSSAVH
jgi:hypothetical protein